MIRCDRVTEF